MQIQGMDVILVADPANMNYLTGYDGWSFYTPQVVVLSLEHNQPFWIGRGMDANGARHTVWMDQEHIIGYPDNLVQVEDDHPMRFAGEFLRKHKLHTKRIGVEKDAYYFTARWLEELLTVLPDAAPADCSLLVNWVRSIKSEQEIAYMKQAGLIAERVMQTAIDNIRPGVRECDAVAEVYRAQMQGLPEFGGDYPAIVPMMPTGEKTSAPHLTWTDEPYRKNQAVNLELAGCRHRYHCPIARTAYVGSNPPQKLKDLAQRTVDGLNLTLEAIGPAMKCEDVELVWRKHIARFGLGPKTTSASLSIASSMGSTIISQSCGNTSFNFFPMSSSLLDR
ncbi:MAG: Xaa-Pro peptidase family protein, partial [Desulfosalsimonas sp.]